MHGISKGFMLHAIETPVPRLLNGNGPNVLNGAILQRPNIPITALTARR